MMILYAWYDPREIEFMTEPNFSFLSQFIALHSFILIYSISARLDLSIDEFKIALE